MVDLIGMMPGYDFQNRPATDVPVQTDLFLLFNGYTSGSTGNVDIHRTSDGTIVDQIPASSAAIISINASGPSANGTYTEVQLPVQRLDPGTSYYVTIDDDAFGSPYNSDADYSGLSDPSAFTFTTAPSRPVLTGLPAKSSYAQAGSPVLIAPNAAFTDADFTAGTVTVAGLASGDQVTPADGGGLTFANGTITKGRRNVGTYGLSKSGTFAANLTSATAEDVQSVVRDLSYASTAGQPAASRDLTITVTDQFGLSTVDPAAVAFTDQTQSAAPRGGPAGGLALADLDGDGRTDIVSERNFAGQWVPDGGYLRVDYNDGTRGAPNFSDSTGSPADSTLSGDVPFAFADLDGDGLPDLVALQNSSVEFFRNVTPPGTEQPDGSTMRPEPQFSDFSSVLFTDGSGTPESAPAGLAHFALGDLTGDGLPDFVGSTAGGLVFYANTGSTSGVAFQSSSEDPFQAIDGRIGTGATVALGDIDGDGKLDLVVGEANGSIVGFLDQGSQPASNGIVTPEFSSTPILIKAADGSEPAAAPDIAVADLTGDGLADVVYRDGTTYGYLQNTTAAGQAVAVQVTPQPAAALLDPASDTGISNSDGLTDDRTPVIDGTAQPGAAVQLFVDGVAVGDPVTADATSGAYSVVASGLKEGSNTITVTQEVGGATSAMSPALTVTLDTTAPFASSPTLTVVQNGGPVPIGIAAPSDNLTAGGSLAIAAGALPTDGTVTLADGTPVGSGQVLTAAQLTGLLFTPTGTAGASSVFTYSVTDEAGNAARGRATLNVGAPNATPTPAPQPTPVPDTISIDQQVSYKDGGFTLTGTASSAAGVRSVEITAQVDGVATDLGAATVNADGTFTFQDRIGAHTQGFITATETDNAGATAAAQADYSLTGGLPGGKGRQDRYTAGGSAVTATDVFKVDGSQTADVLQPGQTFTSSFFDTFRNGGAPLSTFVFDPGFGRDTIDLFRVDGVDHDTLSFKGSDYGNDIATVLASAKNTNAGLLITDPTASSPGGGPGTHDTLLLKGITKQQLAANGGDITFHA